jgi:hypothetical protein
MCRSAHHHDAVHSPRLPTVTLLQALKSSKWVLDPEEAKLQVPRLDPYDNVIAMSLKEFVEHPIAQELLHENQIMQVGRW